MAVRDVLYIGPVILALALGFFGVHTLINDTMDDIIDVPTINESKPSVAAFDSVKNTTARMDKVIFFVFIGLVLALIITSWFIGAHPVFIILYLLIVIVSVSLNAIYSNVWETFSTSTAFTTVPEVAFPLTNHLLLNMPLYGAAIGVIGMIVMFAKPYLTGQEGDR